MAVRACGGAGAVPPDVATILSCWCTILGEAPHTVERCAELAESPSDFKLVGASSFQYLSTEEMTELTQKLKGLDPCEIRRRPLPSAEAGAALAEFMQAGIDLHAWATEQRKQ